jgi:hypothetical protein
MLIIKDRQNKTQRLRDKDEQVEVQEETHNIYLPFDNCGRYADLWKQCSTYLEEFEAFDTQDLHLTESKSNSEKYSLLRRDDTVVKDDLTAVHVSSLLVLLRYRSIVKTISNKTFNLVSDFFHELESNREYHARQIYVLARADKSQLEHTLKPYVKGFKPVDLEPLDKILFQVNADLNESPYDCIWLLNHLLIHLATFEINTFPTLFKEDYLSAIVSTNVSNLPSNVRLLSRIVDNKKEKSKIDKKSMCMPKIMSN